MFKLKRTNKTLIEVGFMLRKGLQDELKAQKHNATGKLSRGLKYHIKNNVLSIMSSVSYWKAVKSWLNAKRGNGSLVEPTGGSNANSILRRMKEDGYGRQVPYRFYEEGNRLPRRTDFAGYTANKFKDKIVQKLAPSIGKDVADMIAEQIKRNNPTINVQKAF